MELGIEGGFENRENRLLHFSLKTPVMHHYDLRIKTHHLKQEVNFYFMLFLRNNVLASLMPF